MKAFSCILALLALPAAAAANDNSFDLAASLELQESAPNLEQKVQEEERGLPESGDSMPLMEYIYRYSEGDFGMILTDFAGSLGIESDFGFYGRWGVGISEHMAVNLALRYYNFENSDTPAPRREGVRITGLILGIGYRRAIAQDISFVANGGLGMLRWESNQLAAAQGFCFSVEGGLTFRLHEALRLRMGPMIDFASTAFHDSSGNAMNMSWILGLEIGG